MAAFNAAVRWCACTISNTSPGFGGAPAWFSIIDLQVVPCFWAINGESALVVPWQVRRVYHSLAIISDPIPRICFRELDSQIVEIDDWTGGNRASALI
jgi:hypothetical protein